MEPATTRHLRPDEIAQIGAICDAVGNDPHRMLDILLSVQDECRWIAPDAMQLIADRTGLSRIAVEGVASFYAFLSQTPKGRVTIRLCDDIIDRFAGMPQVVAAFETALGIKVGETTPDGAISLDYTACIGMCDQAPAAMVNDVVLTKLTPDRGAEIVAALQAGQRPEDLISDHFANLTPHDRATRQVENNIRHAGAVLLGPGSDRAGLENALTMTPDQIIGQIEASGLRGCGGAGFPTGRKWRIAANAEADRRIIICNADEGEPGTFKDRVLLTERPHLLIEGMTIAARAVGAREGILYLRGEYVYLRALIEETLEDRRNRGLLGQGIQGQDGFDFDIRLQMGAGAYICGEEGALISSCEGLPGEPKTRPPFPAVQGYLGLPTVVNNVETFCNAARVLDQGAQWFFDMGTEQSHGTKLFSVSGDCLNPGIYELPYGLSVRDLLVMAGAEDAAAVAVGGASGTMIARDQFDRRFGFDDLSTGGAVVVFNGQRNILEIVEYYMSFFVHESCGYCTPCRVGNVFLQKAIGKFRQGLANPEDIDYLKDLSGTIIETSRCGLGTTSPNPILSTLENFPLVYAAMVKPSQDRIRASFDIQSAIDSARHLAKRRSTIFDEDFSK
ncbi:NAD-reducing hydrogenase HoxS subunit alpha [Thalassovita gelatinovora]|uniref:NAD-reducing hydrogenase HoxS subunit alpha n=1 Tax=Thalassovita gelatinovora TaxID=53501 RepID=A0A0P1G2N7_THAGE|nr:NAD(P)H-dependent oxidoreductase subunit E [Thalassovita gelatinovora]QIZ82048.1 NADH:ubiquinone oxidoreductase [Thalassovita gelatinovora]CUH67544.1 NAD-reducing hydrogenase HoxS subunit alpha [Thalassovita gelatinovora]SEP72074.1 NAD(P)-dependent nickel-iron dehydrogenase flavin-containing subunit [Thalassovita gelatinovora]